MSSLRSRSGGNSIGKTLSRLKKIAPKRTSGDRGVKIAIGRGNYPHVAA